jgi:hypothetical protein
MLAKEVPVNLEISIFFQHKVLGRLTPLQGLAIKTRVQKVGVTTVHACFVLRMNG